MNLPLVNSVKFSKSIERWCDTDEEEKLKKKLADRLLEKHVEEFYLKNLNLIENGLSLWKKGNLTGHQFETPDGGIMDILTITENGEFVVLEFKRGRSSDEAIGQLLRYMGWVYRNLSSEVPVRGYLIARDFEKYIDYALIGMQHPQIPNSKGKDLIKKFRHVFDTKQTGVENIKI